MATYATKADIDTIKALYAALITEMTYASSASTLAIYQQQATNNLNLWADASLAFQNLNASAASNYSSSVGTSVTKRQLDDAQTALDNAWQAFVDALARGGVVAPSTGDESTVYWDLTGTN